MLARRPGRRLAVGVAERNPWGLLPEWLRLQEMQFPRDVLIPGQAVRRWPGACPCVVAAGRTPVRWNHARDVALRRRNLRG